MQNAARTIFKCPHCATDYYVSFRPTPTKDSGTAYCKVCRKKMIAWNDYSQPSFTPVMESLNEDLPRPSVRRLSHRYPFEWR